MSAEQTASLLTTIVHALDAIALLFKTLGVCAIWSTFALTLTCIGVLRIAFK